MPEIRMRDVSMSYGDTSVLDGVDLDVGDKELVTLLGPSGCGKTTTLMLIAGFQRPDTGRITCGDDVFFDAATSRSVPAERRNLGIVFQSYAIWPHMTVAANVGFPLVLRKLKRRDVARRVGEMLELVELGELGGQYPHQLSGGQQQRVALARALSSSPSVLLLDEPFSNLDAKLRERSRKWLRELQQEIGITTVFVTHDQDEALGMSDRVMVMDQGVIQQSGTPEEIYLRPANRTVADFVGRCNFVDGRVVSAADRGIARVQLDETDLVVRAHRADGLAVGAPVTVALRPETLEVATSDAATGLFENQCRAEIRGVAFLGDHYEYELTLGAAHLMAQSVLHVPSSIVTITVPDEAGTVVS